MQEGFASGKTVTNNHRKCFFKYSVPFRRTHWGALHSFSRTQIWKVPFKSGKKTRRVFQFYKIEEETLF